MNSSQVRSANKSMERYFFRVSAKSFKNIPGSPFAYWISGKVMDLFMKPKLSELGSAKQGLATSDNSRFVRGWQEVSFSGIGFNISNEAESIVSERSWFPYNKGGEKRKWYGNQDFLVNWRAGGYDIRSFERAVVRNSNFYFKESVSWGLISSGGASFRYYPNGFIYDVGGMSYFSDGNIFATLGMLNTSLYAGITKVLNPTVNLQIGDVASLPYSVPTKSDKILSDIVDQCIKIAKDDWDSYESSWGFINLQLHTSFCRPKLREAYQKLRLHWREMVLEMQGLEEQNNRIFIEAYGLQDELTPDVPLKEITLTCNPHYRYGGDKSEEELEALLLADTMRELVSYAVGCMFGRYSLDRPGLVLANQGETLADYLTQVPQPSFPADDDNVIPLLDGDWFPDDITLRFRQFMRVAFGDSHYEDNLAFIEQALNIKGKRNYSMRDYFLSEFYAAHVKRYKKRPIYWLFSSPKGNFNALIYMHRYRPDTVSVVLQYLREYRKKLTDEKARQAAVSINPGSSQTDKTKALKEVERLAKILVELEDYERDVLYPLATEQKQIDLDDGVKVNYLKFGTAVKKITGLDAKDED